MDSSSRAGKIFKAAWGSSVFYITLIVAVFLLCMPVLVLARSRLALPSLVVWMTTLLPVLILGSSALFAAFTYEITSTHLLIRRLLWKTAIPLSQEAITEFEPHVMKGSLRIFGNGGLFGFYGWFWSKRLGRYTAYVTDMSRCVVIRTGDKTIVVSPDRPAEFVELMRQFRRQAR